MGDCFIEAVVGHQPATRQSNESLVAGQPGWNAAKITAKTGIVSRPVVGPGETAADLAFIVAEKLFAQGVDRESIDALIVVTQSPDYLLPATACLLQARLGLRDSIAAFDVNLGCSSMPYLLWVAKGLLAGGGVHRVLLLFAETYSRYCGAHDVGTASIFSDGAAAVLVGDVASRALGRVGPARLGTDGSGAAALMVADGGARALANGAAPAVPRLVMDGAEVFRFALDRVKPQVEQLLAEVGLSIDEVDRWFLHQANRFMLEALRAKLGVRPERLPIDVAEVGNAATASLPLLVARQLETRAFARPCRSLLVGFGVGFSWGSIFVEWR